MFSNAIRAIAASLALAAMACGPETAASPQSVIVLKDPWAGTTNPGATVAAGYVTLRNAGVRDDRLLSAESPRALRVELHEMSIEGGVMRMRRVEGIDIAVSAATTLRPSGLHIMFLDIDAPFLDGEVVPVTLRFAHAGAVEAAFIARPRHTQGGPAHEH